jgi:hypothetical protein
MDKHASREAMMTFAIPASRKHTRNSTAKSESPPTGPSLRAASGNLRPSPIHMKSDTSRHHGDLRLEELLDRAQTFAQEQPGKALAAGLAVGMLMNLIPSRLFTGAAKLAAPLVRPALLTLGVLKACELYCLAANQKSSHK